MTNRQPRLLLRSVARTDPAVDVHLAAPRASALARASAALPAATPGRGGDRWLSGRFQIAGHDVRCDFRYRKAPPADAGWWRRWQAQTANCGYFHVQQLGGGPNFLGVAAEDKATGRAFTHELICGGWFWTRLRRRHHCFLVRENRVEVHVGATLRPDRALSQQTTSVVLPLARAALARQVAETARREAAWAAATKGSPATRLTELAGDRPPAGVAHHAAADATLVVAGAWEQSEAEALVAELVDSGRWQPAAHGQTLIWCGPEGIDVACERPAAAKDFAAFARGFGEWVVVSDLHLGLPHRDTFGPDKARAFCGLLDDVIERRSVLVLNGDFLELAHERYGAIKRGYPEIFARLPRVRRIVYVAGNHDAEVLADRVKQARRTVRGVALRHTYAEVRLGLDGECWLERTPTAAGIRHARAWTALLRHPRVRHQLRELLEHRHGRIFLSHGFAREGVAFKRLGPRDTPEERPQWFIDDSVASQPEAPERLLKLIADRRQRLDRVLQAEWGGRMEIVRYCWNSARGLYFEHGHAAIPACSAGGIGRFVSATAGWLKRCGLRSIEHWFEEDLGSLLRTVHPFGKVREARLVTARLLAVGSWLRAAYPHAKPPLMICGHTHDAAHAGGGLADTFLFAALGARYGNSGAWSSRFRLRNAEANRGEWLTIAQDNAVTVHATKPGKANGLPRELAPLPIRSPASGSRRSKPARDEAKRHPVPSIQTRG